MGRKIVIVGNGEIPEGVAAAIDAADFVIRFNECRSFGPGGSRTDVVAICNTGRPARQMISSENWAASRPVQDCMAIWSVRDPAKFRDLRPVLAVSRPDLDDFCDDLSTDFEAFAVSRGKAHRIIDRKVHEATDAALSSHEPGDYVVPSSGLIVLAELLVNAAGRSDTISIAGFGHSGWDGHPFAAEKRLVESYVADGRITRLHPLLSLSQGA